jgi:hypothetical protein
VLVVEAHLIRVWAETETAVRSTATAVKPIRVLSIVLLLF